MEWEDKVKLVTLSNNATDVESRYKFQDYVLENIDKFDSQAYDMFLNGIELIPEEMQSDISFYKRLYPKIKELDIKGISLRSQLRLEVLRGIYREKLGLE